jgi:hypothetical protein
MTTMTKKDRVLRYMRQGRGLTVNEARSRFGIGNFRALMSDVRQENLGRVVTVETRSGCNRYFLRPTRTR